MSDTSGQRMHLAAYHGRLEEMVELIDGGVDLEWTEFLGTALHASAWKNQTACVSALIGRGANLNAHYSYDQEYNDTPLHGAAVNGHDASVKLLLEGGADASLKNNLGSTALHYARANNHTECIRLLENDRTQGARRLNWPRVRLLFLGHGSLPPVHVAAPEGASSSSAVAVAAGGTGGSGGTSGHDGEGNNNTKGCWLATLDRELIWLIADWLVTMHIADISPHVTGGDSEEVEEEEDDDDSEEEEDDEDDE